MRNPISPAIKGLITATMMISLVLIIYYGGKDADPRLQYLIYIIYVGGIIWTLLSYRRSPAFTGTFGGLFSQGFKCFIVVTLVIVLFTGIFSWMHPEFAKESALAYREQLINENKDKLPAEIEKETEEYQKQYTLKLVSVSIFGYLIIGAGVTALGSALLTRRI
jgi:hypothetical protein